MGAVQDGLLTIGPFSRASLLSIKALRAYHEAGIFVPARVDPVTGYRAYDAGQLADAAVIRQLRLLDVPLASIREILVARDPEVTRSVLAAHGAAMEQRLTDAARIVAALQAGAGEPAVHTPVHVRAEPARHALQLAGRAREEDYGPFLDQAYPTLYALAGRAGATVSGPSGALYPPEVPDEESDLVAYVPIAAPVTVPPRGHGVVLGEIPAAQVAVKVHAGPYETVGDTYRLLGA
jgi:DNA-binding transcriptional MerR regulator